VKRIEHNVFFEPVTLPMWWGLNAQSRRERSREKVRNRAEAFINEIGADKVISVSEHGPTFGRFSVSVWWYREFSEADTLVLRATEEGPSL